MTHKATSAEFPSTVLIVEDEPAIVQLLTEMFADSIFNAISRPDAEEAREVLEQTPIACLLVDKNLPGMNGLELIRLARELQPYCACIIMTAYSSTASAVEALRLGAADYLEKPFDDIQLIAEKVSRAVKHQRAKMERDQLLTLIREYAAQLDQKDAEVGKHRTEVEMFEQVMDARIREATDDLRRKSKILKSALEEARVHNARIIEVALEVQEELNNIEINPDDKTRLIASLSKIKSPK